MKRKNYTDEDFANAVKRSFSIASVLRLLELQPTGGNYSVAKKRIITLNLDTSHFTGMGHLKGKTHNYSHSTPLEKIMIENSTYSDSNKLRKRLIKEGIFEEKCYKCGLREWLGQKISLELEHINGKHFDNRKENLTILCPNCHAQSPSYRGKNKKKHEQKYIVTKSCVKEKYFCSECKNETKTKTKTGCCSKCFSLKNRKFNPSKEELQSLINSMSMLQIAKKIGVSNTAIKKRCKILGIVIPKRYKRTLDEIK